jgi:hypothetical protein
LINLDIKWHKNILLAFVLIIYFAVGILKWNYIINPWLVDGDFLIYRYSKISQTQFNQNYSDAFRYFLFTPKWISTILFGNLFLGLNLIIIYLVHQNKIYIKFAFWLFFWVSFISMLSLGIGLFTNTYDYFYPIVSRIKELQQSPFTLILLLGGFKLYKVQSSIHEIES